MSNEKIGTGMWRRIMGSNPGLAWLFVALLSFLVSYPLIGDSSSGSFILDLMFLSLLAFGAYAVSQRRKSLIVAIALALPTFGSWSAAHVTDAPLLIFGGLVVSAIFFIFILSVLMSNIINSDEVTADTIYGAMSAYLLIGVTWSFFYAMLEIVIPGAFEFGPLAAQAQEPAIRGELRFFGYYSLVTLSTLGYGDITPLAPLARSLSALEAITGQLFIAVLIARLVGIHIAQKHGR